MKTNSAYFKLIFLVLISSVLTSSAFAATMKFRGGSIEVTKDCSLTTDTCYTRVAKRTQFQDNLVRVDLYPDELIMIQGDYYVHPPYDIKVRKINFLTGIQVWEQGRFIPAQAYFTENHSRLMYAWLSAETLLQLPNGQRASVTGLGYSPEEKLHYFELGGDDSDQDFNSCGLMEFQGRVTCVNHLYFSLKKGQEDKITQIGISRKEQFACENGKLYTPKYDRNSDKVERVDVVENQLISKKFCKSNNL